MGKQSVSLGGLKDTDGLTSTNSINSNTSVATGKTSNAGNPFSNVDSGMFTVGWGQFMNIPSTIITPSFGSMGVIDMVLTTTIAMYNMYKAFNDRFEQVRNVFYHMIDENNNDANKYVENLRKTKTRESIYKQMSL